jgi:hypothetical protein
VYLNSDEPGMGESVLTVSEACLTRATWNDMLTHSQYYISSYSQ